MFVLDGFAGTQTITTKLNYDYGIIRKHTHPTT